MKKDNKGFTLAELLVVVAIIAVLVAISVAIFAGSQKKAQQAACEANRTAVKHHMVVDYLSGNLSVLDDDVLKQYMDMDEAKCPKGGEFYIEGNFETGFVIKCTIHGDETGGKNSDFSSGDLGNALTEIVEALWDEYFNTGNEKLIDSGAGTARTDKVLEIMKKYNISVDKEDAVSWAVLNNKSKGATFMYWTPVDIQSVAPGTEVPFMRYNVKTGTYTVWNCKTKVGDTAASGGKSYIAFEKELDKPINGDSADQTYEKAKKVLEEEVEKFNKQ